MNTFEKSMHASGFPFKKFSLLTDIPVTIENEIVRDELARLLEGG